MARYALLAPIVLHTLDINFQNPNPFVATLTHSRSLHHIKGRESRDIRVLAFPKERVNY